MDITGVGICIVTTSQTGNINFSAATSVSYNITIKQAAPAITWAAPASIPYSTALSAIQLDASSTIPGVFVYSPSAGAVLTVGPQTLSATFTPTDATDYTTQTQTVTLTISLGTSTLGINATSVGFGDVALNTPAMQIVSLSSTGTTPVTVRSAVVTGTGFTLSGPSFPATLTPGQTATLNVQFNPTVVGAASGALTITSTSSSNPTALIALSGTGISSSYEVDLSWNAPFDSTDPVAGYNVYRSPSGSSTYQLLNSADDVQTAYVDSTVQIGQTYDYMVESVDASGVESIPSNMIGVTIP